jgi:molybdenum cofactor cytidylyltransferase
MGAFKPLLPFGKQTVIESCINYLKEGGAESVVVVVGHRAEDIRNHLSRDDSIRFAINPDPTSEMAASIAVGVRALHHTPRAALISPVDYPAISPSVVSSLITQWSRGSRLVKPTRFGKGGHPVLVDLSLREELLHLDPALGLKSLFDKFRNEVTRVEVDSPYIARDIDTWDDYRGLYEEIHGKRPPDPFTNSSNEKPGGVI